MKHFILVLIIFQSLLISCQNKKNLYILFEEIPEKVYIYPYQNSSDFDIFTYKIKINENYEEEIYFVPFNIEEQKKYIDSNGKYKVKLQQNVIDLDSLKNYDIKDYKWLGGEISSFTKFQTLYQFYDKVYIVQMDSIHKKGILTEVLNVEIVE